MEYPGWPSPTGGLPLLDATARHLSYENPPLIGKLRRGIQNVRRMAKNQLCRTQRETDVNQEQQLREPAGTGF